MNIETNKKKKQIAILGSTGSIGTQALQVIEEHPDLYEAYALTANNRVELLIAQARKFQPEVVVIANEEKYSELKEALSDLPIKVYAGTDAICQIVEAGPIDMVLTAMVGYAGLKPTINAIRAKKAIALANKETLVVAGELINRLAQQYRLRRSVPHLHLGTAEIRHKDASLETSQLGNGSKNHNRLRFHDE